MSMPSLVFLVIDLFQSSSPVAAWIAKAEVAVAP
jgi:hypothetical protein